MPVKIFCCYARKDQPLLDELKAHLMPLQRQGLIDVWHDRDISAGTEWESEISEQLNNAHIILLLVSPNFIASEYCYSREMKHAVERHERGEARVIPVILRPVYWQNAPFAKLQTLPKNAKPVISWRKRDEAFLDITTSILKVVEERTEHPLDSPSVINDLGIDSYLYKVAQMDGMGDPYQERIASLANYDEEKNTELLRTLETYLERSGNYAQAARVLRIHINTLRQRLERIHRIGGIDVEKQDNLFVLQLALRVYRLRTRSRK